MLQEQMTPEELVTLLLQENRTCVGKYRWQSADLVLPSSLGSNYLCLW